MTSIITREPELLLPLELGETDVLSFDYTDSLAAGETISSATVTVSVVEGVDPQQPVRTMRRRLLG